ncbi:MAG: PrsW family intramembrane metalloprotease [Anaerolineae bacterium]|nr:PrsW family intramembrane metalloprotease [Anaerolineae bacterium]
MRSGPILLPREEDSGRAPYRRVWRTATLEAILMLAATGAVLLVTRLLNFAPSPNQRRVFGFAFALLPLVLWLGITYVQERRALNTRRGLLTVILLSALGANAVGIPLVERLFMPEAWLANASGGTRILGYMLTISVTQEFIKYAAVRYTVFAGGIRSRIDGIAYALAAGLGYALVLNVNYVLNESASLQALALRITEFTLSQAAVSTIMGYVLAEVRLNHLSGIALPVGLVIASLINALSITVRAGLVIGAVTPTSSASNPPQGLGMAIFLVVVLFGGLSFVINNADERELLRLRER